jgi:large-conductance mechanosensitive channel
MKLLQIILEIIGWLQIVFGATVLAALLAAIIYFGYSSHITKIISFCIIAVGFILGVIWATRIWKKYGTIEWLSRVRRVS